MRSISGAFSAAIWLLGAFAAAQQPLRLLDLDGDTAHTETYYQFVGRNRDESIWIAGGRYIDRFERRAGTWKIALRTNVIEWCTLPPVLPVPFADVPDIAVNGVSSRSKDDPSYQRPLVNRRAPANPAKA